MLRALGSALLVAVVGFSSAMMAGDIDQARTLLAAAMKNVKGTLEGALKASERLGTPISAKFAVEQGILQVSLSIATAEGFAEFVLYPTIGMVREIPDVADPDKLRVAAAQKLAMQRVTVSLLSATENAVRANDGFRAVSIFPMVEEGDPIAVVTLLRSDAFKIVTEKLN